MSNRFSRVGIVLLTAWLALLVLAMAHTTLALPYLSDDFEHGQLIAQIRAGLEPGRDLIGAPFHGQTLVLLRLIFWFGTMAGGMSLSWVRLAICAAHVAGGVGCAILCTRWAGSKLAGFIAGTLYAGALGAINEQIWWPSSAIFCLGATFFIFAIVMLEQDALACAVLMLFLATLGLNGVLIPALVLPIYCWFSGRRRDAGVLLGVILVLLALVSWWQSRQHDREQIELSLRGLELGAWLIGTAPFRFFAGFTTFGVPGFRTILQWSPIAWLPLLVSAWFISPRHRRVLLLVWAPALLLALLVGVARANYHDRYGPGVLYVADRYYYFFLLPLVTHCVLFFSQFRLPRLGTAAVFVILAGALIGSQAHFLANVPLGNFKASGRALEQGRVLVETIRSAAAAQPFALADASIPIDGAHRNALTLAFLIYSEYPHGIPGVRLVRGPLNATENALLKPWLRRASSGINFKTGSYEEDLISGFSWWEAPFRWMAGSASLHLFAAPGDLVITAYAPVDQLHRPIHVAVGVDGRAVGDLTISEPGTHDYRLDAGPLTPGKPVEITLTSDVVWHARDIFPQSLDERDLSIALSAIGFDTFKVMPDSVSERMRADWNERAREDAHYYVAFGGRDQDEAEFLATAADVLRSLEAQLKRLPAKANRRAWRALEIGCGPGRLVKPMSRHFGEIHGVDVSDEMIRLARQRLADIPHAHFHATNGASLAQFADDSFEFVYSYAVFQHIPSRDVVLEYMREIRRVLKPGGVFHGQFNGLAHTHDTNTWSGVVFSADDIRAFTRDSGLQLLNLDGEHTQYMWTTWALTARPPGVTEGAASIRRITNAYTGEPLIPQRGRHAALSLWINHLPFDCDLNNFEVLADGKPGVPIYVGPADSEGLQQVNAWLPDDVRTGLVPVELRRNGQPLCPPAIARIIPAGPLVPRIISVTDGINLVLENATNTGVLKIQMEELSSPDSVTAAVDERPVERLDILRTDPRPPRHELNVKLPRDLSPGPHTLQIQVSPRRSLRANIVVHS